MSVRSKASRTWALFLVVLLTLAPATGSYITKAGGGSGGGYDQIQDEGINLTQRTTLDFIGAGVSCVDSGGTKTACTISGGSGPSISTSTWAAALATGCAAGNDGQIFLPTDAVVSMLVCDGAAGEWRILENGKLWEVPILADWTSFNTTAPATTATQGNGYFVLNHPNDTAANGEWQWFYQAQPATPYSFTAWISVHAPPATTTSHNYHGIGFMDSALGDSVIAEFDGDTGVYKYVFRLWTDVFTLSTTYALGTAGMSPVGTTGLVPSIESGVDVYYCITNDGVNRTMQVSAAPGAASTLAEGGAGDGVMWTTFLTQAFDTDMTPNRIMLGNNSDNGGVVITAWRGYVIRTGSTTCGPL